MPQIVALLQDDDKYTQGISANALSKLSEQCETSAICLQIYTDINLKAECRASIGEAMASVICFTNPERQMAHSHQLKTSVCSAYPNGAPCDLFEHQHTNDHSDGYMPLSTAHHSLLSNVDLITSNNREVSFHGVQCLFELSHSGMPDKILSISYFV
jgi:hypothetical protein